MKNYQITLLLLLLSSNIRSQNLTGKVLDESGGVLIGASIYWLDHHLGTTTDADGYYHLPVPSEGAERLVASFVGYRSDTIDYNGQPWVQFQLSATELLDEVVVKDRREGAFISSTDLIKTEVITSLELKKAACCDLAGCFETQLSVDPQVTNVVTNSKELRIVGLSGVYNQVLVDGLPMIQGLTYTYGITSIPGTLVDNIFVAKGTNSVLQGYESISGQINVITKDPDPKAPLFLNAYINSFGEKQLNADAAFKVGNWKNLLAVHTVQPAGRRDRDQDDFLDVPLLRRYLVSNKLKYGKEGEWGWSSEIVLRFLNEERTGGQTGFDATSDRGSDTIYGQHVRLNQPEIRSKTSYRFDDNHGFSLFLSGFHQQQDAWFGTVSYKAGQSNLYGNFQYEWNYTERSSFKTGVSYRHLNLREELAFSANPLDRTYAGEYQRREYIPGVFAENSLELFDSKLSWLAGIRADRHNQFGWMVTPRTLLKFSLDERTVIRANMGTGWRTVNLFSENINLLASSRDIVFAEALDPEQASNFGINLTRKIERPNVTGYWSADFYHTNFQNQIFPDYDSDGTKAIIRNYRGTSISNSFQLETGMRFFKTTDFKLGYTLLDVYRRNDDSKKVLPFNSRHKMMAVLGYRPLSDQFQIDVNAHWYGKQRLPSTQSNPDAFRRPEFSDPFSHVNVQFTYNFGAMEMYGGCENIFDFRQERPILSWENPFGRYFDTSFVWGPTRGREFYLGVRYRLIKE